MASSSAPKLGLVPAADDANVLSFVSLKEFMESDFSRHEWIMYPFVKEGSSMMLYGRQGIGKSSAVMQLIESLTTGKPWLGFEVRKPGKVMYLQLDMGQAEALMLFERASDAGCKLDEELIRYPLPPEGEEVLHFNILDPTHEAELAAWVAHEEPVAVIVDTIADAYESEGRLGVNEEVRAALRAFRRACGKAVFIYLQHERKKAPKFGKKGDDGDDSDAYMGATAFEATVTASLQIASHGPKWALNLRKVRLAPKPAGQFILLKNEHGFFEVEKDHAQMLTQWPGCIDDAEVVETITQTLTSKNDVFRDIAERCGSKFETVKKAYARGKSMGTRYDWEQYLLPTEDNS